MSLFDIVLSSRETMILYQRKDESVKVFAVPIAEVPKNINISSNVEGEKYIVVKKLTCECKEEVNTMKWIKDNKSNLLKYCPEILLVETKVEATTTTTLIAMKYLRAMPLHKLFFSQDYISNGKTRYGLPRVIVAAIFAQLCLVLKKFQPHIIHRDLKLPNILLNPRSGAISIVDFGHAFSMTSTKNSSSNDECNDGNNNNNPFSPTGTCHIRAPEMYSTCSNRNADDDDNESNTSPTSIDVFALGCDLVELLTGNPCFGSFEFTTKDKTTDELNQCIQDLVVKPIIRNSSNFIKNSTKKKDYKSEFKLSLEEFAADLCQKLLNPDPAERLKFFSGNMLFDHPFIQKSIEQFFIERRAMYDEGQDFEDGFNPLKNDSKSSKNGTDNDDGEIQKWRELLKYLLQQHDDVEEEIHMQMLGM